MNLASLPETLHQRFIQGQSLRRLGQRGRFAPSPSGELHLGNLRTALLSWLEVRRVQGTWLLRVDDLDRPRVRAGAEDSILHDLHWLGLDWDGPVIRQSERTGLYASVLSSLRRSGLLYPCHCSRRFLADISAPHGKLSIYPGHCRGKVAFWGSRQDRWPSWRLRMEPGPIRWRERWGPAGHLDGSRDVGDVVLRRADGVVAYHLATAVDELILGITEVVRGADLWATTGAHVAVCQALGFAPPRYGHVPLLCDGAGKRLSKRASSEGLGGMRAQGLDAPAVIGRLAASVGLVPAGARLSARELLSEVMARPELMDQVGESLQSFRFPHGDETAQGRQSV